MITPLISDITLIYNTTSERGLLDGQSTPAWGIGVPSGSVLSRVEQFWRHHLGDHRLRGERREKIFNVLPTYFVDLWGDDV